MQDRAFFERAIKEKRLLLTRDKYFKEIDPEGKTAVYLKGETLDEWAQQLKERGVNWLLKPFSRCLQCNTPFKKIAPPKDHPKEITAFWSCPMCHQVFWLGSHTENMEKQLRAWQNGPHLRIGLGGDLMIGRMVNEYLSRVPTAYVWGNLLPILHSTDFNVVNLETVVTRSGKRVEKVFNFKADPENVAVLKEGSIHAVNLANNHILDFSEEGLLETLQVLDRAHIGHVGAGKDLKGAKEPYALEKKGIRIGILGCTDNEPSWKANDLHPGTNFLEIGDLTSLVDSITDLRSKVDLLILSIHWGPNMRERPPSQFRSFAHALIDLGVDIIHGHSAHIFQGVEIYKKKLILYDTGDLVDDYAVDPNLRNDHSFFFIVEIQKKGLVSLRMIPTAISECQVNIASDTWAFERMESLCHELKTFPIQKNNELILKI